MRLGTRCNRYCFDKETAAGRNGIDRVPREPGSHDVKVSAKGFVRAVASVRIGSSDATRQVVLSRAEATR